MAYSEEPNTKYTVIDGSVAYDYSRFSAVPDPRREQERRGEQERAERRRVSPKTAAAARPRLEVPLLGVVGALLCAALLLMMINTSRRINEVNREIVDTKRSISALQDSERDMRAEYDTIVDLRDVEAYARTELNMTTPDADQTIYIDLSGEDTAEVFKEDTSLAGRVGSFISGIFG